MERRVVWVSHSTDGLFSVPNLFGMRRAPFPSLERRPAHAVQDDLETGATGRFVSRSGPRSASSLFSTNIRDRPLPFATLHDRFTGPNAPRRTTLCKVAEARGGNLQSSQVPPLRMRIAPHAGRGCSFKRWFQTENGCGFVRISNSIISIYFVYVQVAPLPRPALTDFHPFATL